MVKKKTNKTSHIKRWLPLIIIAILMAVAFSTGLHEKLSLETLQMHKGALLMQVVAHPILSALIFMGIYTLAVALSLPIATILTLAGGFFFGKWIGTLYVVSAATLGAAIIFTIAKTSLGEALREKTGTLYKRIEGNMKENSAGYLLFMRLVPLFPFFLVNIVPALFNVRLRVFALTTFFGIIPGSFVFVNVGEKLGEIENLKDLISGETLLAFGLLGLFALIPTLYKQFKTRKEIITILLALALSTTAAQASPYKNFTNTYDGLLKTYIQDTEKNGVGYTGVDYNGWKNDARHAQTLTSLTQSDITIFKTQNEKMAFWINAYNFLTIDLIIRENEQKSIKNLGSLFESPWKKYKWDIGGTNYTLDQIEHKILRPIGDARIHFAINCASVSCPDIRPEIYKTETLNAQLEDQVRQTLKNTGKGFSRNKNGIKISKIFDWFSEDFNGGDING